MGEAGQLGGRPASLPLPARAHLPFAGDVRVITKHRRQTNAEYVGTNSHSPVKPVHKDPF